jgi:hypothetical protein
MVGTKEFMTVYTPDRWVVFKFGGDDPHCRVLGGWSGDYLGSYSWRLNSGVTEHDFDGDYWYFYGSSGSCYKCYVDNYGFTSVSAGVYDKLKDGYGDDVLLLDDQEWIKEGWEWNL